MKKYNKKAFIIWILSVVLSGCGSSWVASSPEPTTTPMPTATSTALPTLTPTATPDLAATAEAVALSARLEELQARLGDVVSVKVIEGKNILMYKSEVVGEFKGEDEIGIERGGEIISVLDNSLEIGESNNLLSVNRERTEEMGKEWVEWVWTEDGERLEVPEPVVGLPKTLEDAMVINENILDFYMPKLLASERVYLDKNGWGSNNIFPLRLDYGIPGLPFFTRDISIGTGSDWTKIGEENLTVVGLTKVVLDEGTELLMYSIPGKGRSLEFGQYAGENMVFHFAYNYEAVRAWSSLGEDNILKYYGQESVLSQFSEGFDRANIRTFFSTDRKGNRGMKPEAMGALQWSYVTELLNKMDKELDFSNIYANEMISVRDGNIEVTRDQIEQMQEIMWPVVFVKTGS